MTHLSPYLTETGAYSMAFVIRQAHARTRADLVTQRCLATKYGYPVEAYRIVFARFLRDELSSAALARQLRFPRPTDRWTTVSARDWALMSSDGAVAIAA